MVSAEKAIANRGPLRVRTFQLVLSDVELDMLREDARELGISQEGLLSLVVAFTLRARTSQATCLALADILQYPYRS